jgi:hypothetical protein
MIIRSSSILQRMDERYVYYTCQVYKIVMIHITRQSCTCRDHLSQKLQYVLDWSQGFGIINIS